MLQRLIAHLLIISFLIQLPLGLKASLTSIEDENLVATERFFNSAIPAHGHFKAQKDSTAAGVMVISEHNGKLYTLLGKRDDTQTWCNFGGKTEDGQIYLSQTAAQELMEESCGLYACPAGALNQNTSHTLQLENISYRMYMRDFRYLKSTHFKERMGQATTGSSREYTDFAWVEVGSLLSGNPTLHPDETDMGEPFELFDDFRTMLQESTVRDALSNWGKKKSGPLHTFRRLDISNHSVSRIKTTWARIDGVQRTAIEPSDAAFVVPYGQNAAGEKVSYKTYHKGSKKLILPVPFNPEIERETFANAVVKKARALMELKGNFPQEQETTPVPEVWRPLVEEFRKASPTERHLKWILKDKFVEGRTREAYRANIKIYLQTMNEQKRMETRGNVAVDEESINKLATLLYQEAVALQSEKDPRFCLYHGASGEFGELYATMSTLRASLLLEPIRGFEHSRPDFSEISMHPILLNGVRGTDMYYRQFLEAMEKPENQSLTPAQIFRSVFHRDDYDPLTVLTRICTNPALTCGPDFGASTSNSVEYWFKGHSVGGRPTKNFFDETGALLGIEGEFSVFDSLFRQYYGIRGEDESNGLMVQMFVTPEFLSQYNYAHHVHEPDSSIVHTDPILKQGETHYQYSKMLSLPDSIQSSCYPEVWAYLPPTRYRDSVRFLAYRRHDLSETLLKKITQELFDTWDHILAKWLTENTRLLDGALHGGSPLLHKLHRMASQQWAGESIQDTLPEKGLRHLIELDNVEGVKTLVSQYSESVASISETDRKALLLSSLRKGHAEMAEVLSQLFWNTPNYSSLITKKEASLLVKATLQDLETLKDLTILSKINDHWHFREGDKDLINFWLSGIRIEDEQIALVPDLINIFGQPFIKAFLESVLSRPHSNCSEKIKNLPSIQTKIDINQNFDILYAELDFLNKSRLQDVYYSSNLFKVLDALGLKWDRLYKGKPLIAYFFNAFSCGADFESFLNTHPEVLKMQDAQGRNLRQLAETAVLERQPCSYPSNVFKGPLLVLDSIFPEFHGTFYSASSYYSSIKKCPREGLPALLDYLKALLSYDNFGMSYPELSGNYEENVRAHPLRKTKLQQEANEKLEILKTQVPIYGLFQELPNPRTVQDRIVKEEYLNSLKDQEEKTKQDLVLGCQHDQIGALACLSTLQFKHLLPQTLRTAADRGSSKVMVYLINTFSELPWTEYSSSLEENVGKNLAYSVLNVPNFWTEVFPNLSLDKLKEILLKADHLSTPDDYASKEKIVERLTPEDLHEIRDRSGTPFLSILLRRTHFDKEDRKWVEAISGALSWIDPTEGYPYGSYFSFAIMHTGLFPYYQDLIDFDWVMKPVSSSEFSFYEFIQQVYPSALPKINPVLRLKGLI